MTRLSEHKSHESVTALLYGASGSGKSFLAASVGSDTLIVTPSNGLATIKSKLFRELCPGINPYIEVNDEDPIPKSAQGFDRISDIIDSYLEKKRDEIKNIVVEDATSMRRMALMKGLELNQKLNRSQTLKQSTSKEVIVPTVQDYGIEMNLVDQFMRYYTTHCKALGINFIVTAHERFTFGKPEGLGQQPPLLSIRPGFTGQTFPEDITGLFDLTWHTEMKGAANRTFYQIRTAGDSVLSAKTRYGGLFPSLIETFHPMSHIIKCIETETPLKTK